VLSLGSGSGRPSLADVQWIIMAIDPVCAVAVAMLVDECTSILDVSSSPDTVEITELPVGVWTHDFIETVEAKAKAKNVMLKVHKCQDHDDQHVHLLIGFEPGQLLKGGAVDQATSKIEQLLGLRKRLPSQMWLYQAAPI
ncbi:hypothetical protein AK812_SmicGene43268, partial [Symbiodinium microadriaticum]